MKFRDFAFFGSWVFFFLASAVPREGREVLLDKTVAKVRSEVLTSRQVILSGILDMDFNESSLSENLISLDVNADKSLALALEVAIFNEASSFQVAKVDKKEILDFEATVGPKIKKKKEWRDLEFTSKELEIGIERKLKVGKYLKYKMNSLVSIISDQEVKEYYEKNAAKFPNIEFEKVKGNIKAYLSKVRSEEQLKSWLDVIQKKYKIQVF